MHQVRFEDASIQVQALMGEAMAGEDVVFTRGPKAVLRLVPIENGAGQ